MGLDNKSNDMTARALAVILSGAGITFASFSTQDRFTGSEGAVLAEKVRQMELNDKRLEARIDQLPPAWLKRDLQKIDQRLDAIEQKIDDLEKAR